MESPSANTSNSFSCYICLQGESKHTPFSNKPLCPAEGDTLKLNRLDDTIKASGIHGLVHTRCFNEAVSKMRSCPMCRHPLTSLYQNEIVGMNRSGRPITRSAIKPNVNLDGAILNGASLKGLDLSGVSFRRAQLIEVDFTGSDLTDTDFSYANASKADFSYAELICTCFDNALLIEATLTETTPIGASFINADMTSAEHIGVNFEDADMSGAIGLDTVPSDSKPSMDCFDERASKRHRLV